jgi:hypothetical protein
MIDQPGLFDAKEARDIALAQVARRAGPWRDRALAAIVALPSGTEGTAENIRLRLLRGGLELPHHHNAWGEVIKTAISRHYLVPTGKRAHMQTRKSHARITPVYRRR